MTPFLHTSDALLDLSRTDDALGRWARDRLILWYPDAARRSPYVGRMAALLGPSELARSLTDAHPTDLWFILGSAPWSGALDPDDGALQAALVTALTTDHSPTHAGVCRVLAWLRPLPIDDLQRLTQSPAARGLVGSTVLLSNPTKEVAEALVREGSPRQVLEILRNVGAPVFGAQSDLGLADTVEGLLVAGAQCGGATGDDVLRAAGQYSKGSVRTRSRRLAARLLDNDTSPCGRLLSAVYTMGSDALLAEWGPALLGWRWARNHSDVDAVTAVVEQHAWSEAPTLGRAVAQAPIAPDASTSGGWMLATLSDDRRVNATALDALDAAPQLLQLHAMATELAARAAGRVPDAVADRLNDPARRGFGMLLARYAVTEPIVEALMALPDPASELERKALARALAHTGDPVVTERLRPLIGHLSRSEAELAQALYPRL